MINYKTSSGSGTVSDPTPEFVKRSLFEDPDAWSQTPDVLFNYSDVDRNSKLLIAYAPEEGYYTQFIDGSLWILVSDPNNIDKEVVEVDQDYEVSKGLLCDQDATWRAVEWFLQKGDKCPDLIWISDHKLPNGVVF